MMIQLNRDSINMNWNDSFNVNAWNKLMSKFPNGEATLDELSAFMLEAYAMPGSKKEKIALCYLCACFINKESENEN